MHIDEAFRQRSIAAARALVVDHPFATIVTRDLRATHMPCLLEDGDGDELVIVGHVARADPASTERMRRACPCR